MTDISVTMNSDDHHFINRLVPIEEAPPPEELPARMAGGCGRWQISIGIVAFICEYIFGISLGFPDIMTPFPFKLNFTCINGSDNNPCLTVNGTKCKKFIFYQNYDNITTFTEKFSLICDREYLINWINFSYNTALMISYIMVGVVADKYGRKVAAMIFIPLQCLSGALVAISSTYEMLIAFRFIHALFSSVLNVVPKVTRNKWRTFALGFTTYPRPFSWITLKYLTSIFQNVNGMFATVSLIPLPLLILLLYFKDCPLYVLIYSDFEKGEEALRKIAHYNKHSFSPEIKIRPAKITNYGEKEIHTLSYSVFLQSPKTRQPFLALVWLWFFSGISYGTLSVNEFHRVTDSLPRTVTCSLFCLITSIVAVTMCHYVQHKKIMCVLLFSKNVCIVGTILTMNFSVHETGSEITFALTVVCYMVRWGCYSVLENLTPRMFPTGLRSQGLGFCLGAFLTGQAVTESVIFFLEHKYSAVWAGTLLIVVGLVTETLACFLLWDVHNRELPDFIEDCIHFERYYKPCRYVVIHEKRTTLNEIEVKTVEMAT